MAYSEFKYSIEYILPLASHSPYILYLDFLVARCGLSFVQDTWIALKTWPRFWKTIRQ